MLFQRRLPLNYTRKLSGGFMTTVVPILCSDGIRRESAIQFELIKTILLQIAPQFSRTTRAREFPQKMT